VKQEFNDNNVDFNLLNEDYYNNNNSESVVKANHDNNDNKRFITLRKAMLKDFDNKKNVLKK